ncbi:MAG: ATP-dependent Clp protease adaptor ClpS [Burkholderiaceae bacterium]|nr:ATP-dependent Clp protease adaptor ClpS [Burkholderiaceae bacterium]
MQLYRVVFISDHYTNIQQVIRAIRQTIGLTIKSATGKVIRAVDPITRRTM